jgi:hypothetical protein
LQSRPAMRHADALAIILLLSSPAVVLAQELDATGHLDVSGAALVHGFEGRPPPEGLDVFHFDGGLAPMDEQAIIQLLEGGTAIEGDGALVMGGQASAMMLANTEGLRDRFGDRRVEVKLWYRAEGTRPRAFLIWFSGDVEAAVAAPNFASVHDVGVLPLLPSGRATDDGWVELTSGAFDFLFGRRLAPVLYVDDELRNEQPPFVPNFEGRMRIDAVAFYDRGEAAVPDATCSLVDEDQRCGAEGLCTMGRCADRAVVDGPDFATERMRDAYLARRMFERHTFSGHRAARANLERYDAELAEIVAAPNKRFWSRFRLAVDHLEDGHARGVAIAPVSGLGSGTCAVQSDADLLPTRATLPMVFRTIPAHPVARMLRAGDVLTHVDDVPTPEWRALAEPYLLYPGDDRARDFVTTPQLLGVAMNKGAALRFARCDRQDGVACSEAELEIIEVTTATMSAALWSNEVPAWRGLRLPCDTRFLRTAEASDIVQTGHVATASVAGVRILQINGTPGNVMSWWNEIAAAFDPAPQRMLLDERRGDGGSLAGVAWLTSFFFPDDIYPANVVVPPLAGFEGDTALRDAMFACSIDTGWPGFGYYICGGVLVSNYALLGGSHPAPNVAADTKLGVLTGIDGSGNDWLTYNVRVLRPEGRTRVFGPVPTLGAYGELAFSPLHRVGFGGGSFQMTGGVILGSAADPVDVHVGGRGVEPDEVVFQKQSDAARGIDTQVEAAMQWLTEAE